MTKTQSAIDPKIIDDLLKSYEKPEDLLGEGGIVEQLTKAFAHSAPGTFGTSGRNILFGDYFSSIDISLTKDFRIYRENAIQFRAEAFNLLNHTNFNLPGNRITQGTFGRITSAQDPRILQFALKVRF